MVAIEIPLRSFSITMGSSGDFNELRKLFEKREGENGLGCRWTVLMMLLDGVVLMK